jgi:pimeloyl-ACP methyl ester carboxylesterase
MHKERQLTSNLDSGSIAALTLNGRFTGRSGPLRTLVLACLVGSSTVACTSDDSPASEIRAGLQPLQDGGTDGDADAGARLANDVILVHGAWADGSSWSDVIAPLQDAGFTVQAVQLPEQSLAADAALVRHAIEAVPRPVLVAGHSYGGFVMSEATAGVANVVGLVFIAAFAPDEGETIGALAAGYPPTPAIANLVIDDQGNAIIEPGAFVKYFASDLFEREAHVLAAVQKPTAASILGTPAGVPGWKTIPTFYQVSTNDQVIAPALLRFFAERMGAETIELDSSHVSLISHPTEVAAFIAHAAEAR